MAAKTVTDSVQETAHRSQEAVRKSPVGRLVEELPTDRLKGELQKLIVALSTRALNSMIDRVDDTADRLIDYAERGGGPGFVTALTGTPGAGVGKGRRPVRSLVGSGLGAVGGSLKDAVGGTLKDVVGGRLKGGKLEGGGEGKGGGLFKGALGGALKGALGGVIKGITKGGKGGKGGKLKVTNIIETIDVGVPVRLAYDQWTSFPEWPGFTKKVEDVQRNADDKLTWKAQVFWSHREWQATIIEQVPDRRIVWRSKGPKGYVDGAVTFHELAPELTRIVLVLEYHPQGFFEHTGNLWRAQGRRARLELKHFRRHVMTSTILHPDKVEGWRGEIRDGKVVKDHDTALREEQEGRGGQEERPPAGKPRPGKGKPEAAVEEEPEEEWPEAEEEEPEERVPRGAWEEEEEPRSTTRPTREERRPVVRRGGRPTGTVGERRVRRGRGAEE
jgi:uncharacterized membrane protein